jgi:chemotaxis protein histidine kinase CheA
VEFLRVIFEDITEIVKYEKELQGQKTRYQQEVESVTAILKSGPRIFSDFIDESTHNLINIRLKVNDLDDTAVFNQVFRETHSLKGSAKHLDLNFISSLSHKIEDILLASRNRPGNKSDTVNQIEELIVELFHEFQNLAKMIERLKVFSALDSVVKPPEWKGQLGEFLNSLPPMVDSLAQDLKKNAKLEIENSLDEIPFLPKIKNPLIHLIRNSIDHGIEDQFERLTKNKNASGKIILRLSDSGDAYCIEVEDDGNGIDFERIREKAVEKNLLDDKEGKSTKSELLKLMFTVGFSSKDNASEISGRGYGLDIVKDAADQLNGKIMVNTKKDKGTKFIISIPH